ncbi:MAG TPA: TPM domain-containing protein [Ramlibacter sp.]|uniref:TPM domain-containing protein n=1 Tax=Ramlibacter sp. TaxID=1917967 RepID=UPI002C9645C4|nr:TPM domain-containing protein [Ramlibacter sp.]HVZ44365.1 TPM domain-containing protein [Ramlibacter sp.]
MIRTLLALLLWAPLVALCADAPGIAPPFTALLVDETASLSDEDGQRLLARLQGFQSAGRAQVAVLVAKDTRGLALADFSLRVAEAWKVGRAGKDDGLLVVAVPAQPAARLEVGYGLEGVVPDVVAAQWVDELLAAMKRRELATGLDEMLARIDRALPNPEGKASAAAAQNILDRHPEWKLPFVFAIFSPFAIFPIFFRGWGAVASAPLFAGMLGAAAWFLWSSQQAAATVACIAFVLPIAWSLNHARRDTLAPWLRIVRDIGNAAAVLMFFGILWGFIGVGLSGQREATWGGFLFAGALSLGLAAFLFPGRPQYLLMLVLRSYMHFAFVLTIAYLALMGIDPDPTRMAFAIAGGITALIALSLWLDARDARRASLWLVALVLLMMLPLGVLLLLQGASSSDANTQLAQLAAGGGSIGGVLLWAARHGFFAAVRLGLGGRFGGGGADAQD